VPRGRDDEAALTADLVELARQYGRYGYRKISALLKAAGWLVNDKRVERIWRREGLKVPAKQPKKGRLWDRDVTTTQSGCMPRWAIGRRPPRCSCLPSPPGRLRSPDQLRRPGYPSCKGRPCTNIKPGPPKGADQALHYMHFNFCRIHKTLRVTPAMAAGPRRRASSRMASSSVANAFGLSLGIEAPPHVRPQQTFEFRRRAA
jgi:hypothetical protein